MQQILQWMNDTISVRVNGQQLIIIMIQKYLRKIPIYEAYYQKRRSNQSQFYRQNRVSVLLAYRYFLKAIPKIYPRLLQQTEKLHQLRYFFKESKYLSDRYETECRTNLAKDIIEDLKKNDYSKLADLVPSYQKRQSKDLKEIFRGNITMVRKWWWSGYNY